MTGGTKDHRAEVVERQNNNRCSRRINNVEIDCRRGHNDIYIYIFINCNKRNVSFISIEKDTAAQELHLQEST